VAFYRDVLGARVLHEGEPTFLPLGNIWLTINGGGGPTNDKPEVVSSPPREPNTKARIQAASMKTLLRHINDAQTPQCYMAARHLSG